MGSASRSSEGGLVLGQTMSLVLQGAGAMGASLVLEQAWSLTCNLGPHRLAWSLGLQG